MEIYKKSVLTLILIFNFLYAGTGEVGTAEIFYDPSSLCQACECGQASSCPKCTLDLFREQLTRGRWKSECTEIPGLDWGVNLPDITQEVAILGSRKLLSDPAFPRIALLIKPRPWQEGVLRRTFAREMSPEEKYLHFRKMLYLLGIDGILINGQRFLLALRTGCYESSPFEGGTALKAFFSNAASMTDSMPLTVLVNLVFGKTDSTVCHTRVPKDPRPPELQSVSVVVTFSKKGAQPRQVRIPASLPTASTSAVRSGTVIRNEEFDEARLQELFKKLPAMIKELQEKGGPTDVNMLDGVLGWKQLALKCLKENELKTHPGPIQRMTKDCFSANCYEDLCFILNFDAKTGHVLGEFTRCSSGFKFQIKLPAQPAQFALNPTAATQA